MIKLLELTEITRLELTKISLIKLNVPYKRHKHLKKSVLHIDLAKFKNEIIFEIKVIFFTCQNLQLFYEFLNYLLL